MRAALLALLGAWERAQGRLAGLAAALAAPGAPAPAGPPRKILVLRPDEAGDNVLNTAFLRGLHRAFPRAELWLGVKPALVGLMRGQAGLDGVLALRLPPRRLLRFPQALWQGWRQGLALRGQGFDACFLPRFGPDYHGAAWAAWAAGIPRREGFGLASPERAALDPGLERLLTRAWAAKPGPAHELERLAGALAQLGSPKAAPGPALTFSPRERGAMRERLRGLGWDGRRPLVMLGLDAGHPRRAWPLQAFAQAAALAKGPCWLLQAAPSRAGQAAWLGGRLEGPWIDGSGFDLREAALAASLCQAYLGADSAPKHLALAAGVPAVELSAHARGADPGHASAPERFGPWRPGSRVLRPAQPLPPCRGACRAAGAHCITQIHPAEAARALRSILRREGRPAPRRRKTR